MISILWIKSS